MLSDILDSYVLEYEQVFLLLKKELNKPLPHRRVCMIECLESELEDIGEAIKSLSRYDKCDYRGYRARRSTLQHRADFYLSL